MKTRSRRTRKRWPLRLPGAELIIKENLIHLDNSEREVVAVPAIVILGNSQGFRYLSRVFEYLADHTPVPPASAHDTDPEDHQHLDVFDYGLSDTMEIRLGHITPGNRSQVFRKFGVSKATADRRCLTKRYAERIYEANHALGRRGATGGATRPVTTRAMGRDGGKKQR